MSVGQVSRSGWYGGRQVDQKIIFIIPFSATTNRNWYLVSSIRSGSHIVRSDFKPVWHLLPIYKMLAISVWPIFELFASTIHTKMGPSKNSSMEYLDRRIIYFPLYGLSIFIVPFRNQWIFFLNRICPSIRLTIFM